MINKLTISDSARRKVAVISHERSGTHFLMNTIALNFDYIVEPWWNFDFRLPVNFHSHQNVEKYLRRTHDQAVLNILKSHHSAGFFEQIIDYVSDQFQIFYIYRDPRDALISNWKLIRSFRWDEGPRPTTAAEFIRLEPRGAMLRYQKDQEKNMLTRWQTHVEGWLRLASGQSEPGICLISYEELNLRFPETLNKISTALGLEPGSEQRPPLGKNVIGRGAGKVGSFRDHLDDQDREFVWSEIGDTMSKLGYAR